MSRLIVKNLPKSVTEDKLREIFGAKGIVTDVQLKYTKDGKFRHFGFIGFRDEDSAQKAVDYFDNSCIKSARIRVELCAALGDPKKPKAWSKYAPDSSAFKKMHIQQEDKEAESEGTKEKTKKKKKKKEPDELTGLLEKHKDDPLFQEYMEAHARGSNTLLKQLTEKDEDEEEEDGEVDENGQDDSGHDSKGSIVSGSSSDEDEMVEDVSKIAAKKEISDLEYLKMKMVKGNEIASDPSDDETIKKEKKKSKKEKKETRKIKKEEAEVKEEEEEEEEEDEESTEAVIKKEGKCRVDFFTVKLRGLSYNSKKKDIKHFFLPLKPKSIRLPVKMKGIAYVGFKTEKEMKQALVKHRSFLAGRRICVLKYSGMSLENGSDGPDRSRWQEQEDKLKAEETIAESGRLFVRNLSYTVTEDEIDKLFQQFGPLAEVNMPVDRLSRKPKGFALVTFVMPEHAVIAHSQLDGTIFHGRMLHVLPGKAKKSVEELLESDHLGFKQKKLLKEKAQAKSSHNWNSLFLGQNAIADLIADTYNTTKEKVLDARGKESVAVRLALGETQIVAETREFLLNNGVSLDAFNQAPKERSKTIILAKNLPAKTTTAEIQQLFMKYGEIGRVVMPPSGVTAIIEFLEPSEARNAFTKLAYTRFKNLPLYLEWAPSDTFTSSVVKKDKNSKVRANEANKTSGKPTEGENEQLKEEEEEVEEGEDEDEDDDDDEEPEPDTTLFIKNLNFDTREDAIKEHFRKCGPIHYVTVALKKDPSRPGELLSMGYGFIQFKKKTALEKALKTLQHSVLEGHTVELKRSNRTLQSEVATARKKAKIGKQTGCKILVRNIPFQANKKEIEDLFKTFGKLKALRLPKKMVGTGPHRGFAFIEYYTKHDAKRAFEALCQSTHLYGRRLVLEWAATEESIDDIRKRTADHFSAGPNHHTSKKSTVDFMPDDEV